MTRQKITKETPDLKKERLEELKRVIPEAFTEGKIDAEKFFTALGEDIDSRPERYSFSWAGKKDAIRILQTTSRGTLKPAKDESVNWDETQNLFIEGDNLEVLKLLYKSYFGRVKMIYIDPPYNTGNDFIYPDNYADPLDTYLRISGQKDENGNLLTSNPETNGRYHSTWLSMMYPRLFLARQLLREDGVIFVSIDDHEMHNLRLLMNEVFGEENFMGQITVLCNPKGRSQDKYLANCHEYLMIFSKTPLCSGSLSVPKSPEEIEKDYPLSDDYGIYRELELRNTHREFGKHNRPKLYYPFYVSVNGKISLSPQQNYEEIFPDWDDGFNGCWTWGKDKAVEDFDKIVAKKVNGRWKIYRKAYAAEPGETPVKQLKSIWNNKIFHTEKGQTAFNELFETREKIFQSPKSVNLVAEIIRMGSEPDSIILDFFSGSCTTAQAVLELNREDGGNRRFIMVQLPEPTDREDFSTIADIGKERIRRVIKKFQNEPNGKLDFQDRETPEDLGFKVFKLSPSNYQIWENVDGETDPDVYKDLLKGHDDPLVNGWKEEDVLYEIALKEGYSLNAGMEKEKVGSLTVYRIDDPEREQAFRVCLEKKLTLDALKPLNLKKDDLFVCRNIALDDTIAANLALQCRLMVI